MKLPFKVGDYCIISAYHSGAIPHENNNTLQKVVHIYNEDYRNQIGTTVIRCTNYSKEGYYIEIDGSKHNRGWNYRYPRDTAEVTIENLLKYVNLNKVDKAYLKDCLERLAR